jgi:glycosyltransferase involved in cell wall biosynthesis
MPEISVLLPVRNAGPYLGRSLASLTRQTFRDFEIVAVNDGSTDGSGERLEEYAAREPRLRVIHTRALGLPSALNTALHHASGSWLARHDADDLSHPTRFAKQRDLLRHEHRVSVVGTRIRLFPHSWVGTGMRRWAAWHNSLLTHEQMANEILIDSTLVHGTAMFRRSAIEKVAGYRDEPWAEDVDLWLRLLEFGRFAKISETLYSWRQHPSSATRRDPRYGRDRLLVLKREALQRILPPTREMTLVGVGKSLETWRVLLEKTYRIALVEAARPAPSLYKRLFPPIALVFGAQVTRNRWREYLVAHDMVERESFVFVA